MSDKNSPYEGLSFRELVLRLPIDDPLSDDTVKRIIHGLEQLIASDDPVKDLAHGLHQLITRGGAPRRLLAIEGAPVSKAVTAPVQPQQQVVTHAPVAAVVTPTADEKR
jgi:hypothetical protein